jgi:hypothetical protein
MDEAFAVLGGPSSVFNRRWHRPTLTGVESTSCHRALRAVLRTSAICRFAADFSSPCLWRAMIAWRSRFARCKCGFARRSMSSWDQPRGFSSATKARA